MRICDIHPLMPWRRLSFWSSFFQYLWGRKIVKDCVNYAPLSPHLLSSPFTLFLPLSLLFSVSFTLFLSLYLFHFYHSLCISLFPFNLSIPVFLFPYLSFSLSIFLFSISYFFYCLHPDLSPLVYQLLFLRNQRLYFFSSLLPPPSIHLSLSLSYFFSHIHILIQ